MRKSDIAQARALVPGQTLPRQVLPRQADLVPNDLRTLFAAVRDMHCISLVGVSNLGKSALLRSLTDATMQERYLGREAANYLPIYIDLNQMLDMTEQAFYELILRCAIDVLDASAKEANAEVLQRVRAAYDALVKPSSNFQVPLSFAQAMAAIGDLLPQKVALLFDELDGPVCEIDGRVFLNLRALKDKHWQGLTYVTATNRRLEQLGQDGDVAEFAELFARHVLYISPLNDAEIAAFVARFAADEGVTFSEEDLAFIRLWAGGHPGLLEAICHLLGSLTGPSVRDATQDWIIHRRATELIPHDTSIQTECHNIWSDLTSPEQEALLSLFGAGSEKSPPGMDSVIAQRLVIGQGPERRIFAAGLRGVRAATEYRAAARRHRHPRRLGERRGVGERRPGGDADQPGVSAAAPALRPPGQDRHQVRRGGGGLGRRLHRRSG